MYAHKSGFSCIFILLVVSIDVVKASYCEDVQRLYAPKNQTLAIYDKFPTISLHWGSDPSRAASAILQGVLRYALGVQNVILKPAPLVLTELMESRFRKPITQMTVRERYTEIIVALSTSWKPGQPECIFKDKFCRTGIAGPRMHEFGTSRVPTLQELYVYLPRRFRVKECANAILWSFYMDADASTLDFCGFGNTTLIQKIVTVYGGLSPSSVEKTQSSFQKKLIESLKARIESSQRHVQFEAVGRKRLLQMLQEENHSFLFVDYEMWSGYESVNVIQLPPCIPNEDFTCEQNLDPAIAIRVTEVDLLKEKAPNLYQIIYEFTPSKESIREILAFENNTNIEEVACKWISKHSTEVNTWVQTYSIKSYDIVVGYCSDDPDSHDYNKVLTILNEEVNTEIISANLSIVLNGFSTNCSNADDFKYKVTNANEIAGERLIGAIAGGMRNINEVIDYLNWAKLPTIIYNTDEDINLTKAAWLTAGHSLHTALATRHLISNLNCTEVTVLSDTTEKARYFITNLDYFEELKLHNYHVRHNLTLLDAKAVLRKIQMENAGVILLNTNYDNAITILLAASKLNMNATDNFTWIVRDWRRDKKLMNADINYIAISSLCLCGKYVSNANDLQSFRDKMDELWPDCSWPARAAAIADAVLTLVNGLKTVVLKNFEIMPQTNEFIELLNESLIEAPIRGLTHDLKFNKQNVEEAAIFVYEWNANNYRYLAEWRVNTTARTVHVEHEIPNLKLKATRCLLNNQSFNSALYLMPYLLPSLFIILILGSIITNIVSRSLHHGRFSESNQDNVIKMIQLSTFKVERSMLKLYEKLDTGQISNVRLGIYRTKAGTRQAVAVKQFFNEEEKQKMMIIASTLASFDHDHIIRLVGVYFEDRPSLMIMEFAFFGNLRQYLRDRRYLVKNNIVFEEKSIEYYHEGVHVSPAALTRLTRQAASALAYLAMRGIVHRDLHASNCLVAADRSLKISGFDIAQNTENIEGTNKYEKHQNISYRWLAPESLKGEFSTASDIWAFGVLVFEIVTLGSLPYGDLGTSEVIKLVSTGGSPKLPRHASPETYELTQRCWRSAPEERSTASEIEAYLADRQRALSPAIPCDENQSNKATFSYH